MFVTPLYYLSFPKEKIKDGKYSVNQVRVTLEMR